LASSFQEDVKRALMELGYIEGRTIAYEARFAQGRTDQLPDLAAELVELKVDIVITTTAPAVRAATQATSTIPIVIGGVDDAVEQGFVASLAKPGGSVTGTSWLEAELSGKRIDLLRQAMPGLSRIGVLREAVGSGTSSRVVVNAAQALGLQVYMVELRAPNELDGAFSEMARTGIRALNVLQGPMITTETSQLAYLASTYRIPAIFPDRSFAEAGGLMSYGPNLRDMYRRTASYVDQIVKGVKPGDLPVEQPTKFEFIVNLRTAKALDLEIPPSLLVRADEVIE
jgi:putative ABC transport system substrate-binding protein